jgi:hypothetical protein
MDISAQVPVDGIHVRVRDDVEEQHNHYLIVDLPQRTKL